MLRSLVLGSALLVVVLALSSSGPDARLAHGASRPAPGASRLAGAGPPTGTRSLPEAGLGAAGGCARPARPSTGPKVLAVRIVKLGAGELAEVGVCVDGVGPLPFLVDSGSSASVISTQLSRRLDLQATGAAGTAQGVGCRATVVPEQVTHWSADGLALDSQTVFSATIPSLQAGAPLSGVIGSDVLSRFGAVRLDYRTGTLELARPESPSPTDAASLRGGVGLPAGFLTRVDIRATLSVVALAHAVVADVRVGFGRSATYPFVVDTGAAVSLVSPVLARSAGLAPLGRTVTLAAFGCTVRLPELATGRWTVGSVALVPQPIAEIPSTGIQIDGSFGSDVLSRYGAAVIDYDGARLILESG